MFSFQKHLLSWTFTPKKCIKKIDPYGVDFQFSARMSYFANFMKKMISIPPLQDFKG